jgi:mono/diheme cytochrome c family protein
MSRRALPAILAAAAVLGAAAAVAQPAARQQILTNYLAQAKQANPSFAGFDAERGAALFRSQHPGGDSATPACTSCHGDDPRNPGQNAKTGKPIEPMAVSANPKRYTNKADVEKWFGSNCKQVLGRECTPAEKGDFITFMMSP